MQWNTFYLQAIEEVSANVVEQYGSSWHKVRHAIVQLVYMVIGTASHVHQLCFSVFRLLAVGHGFNAILLSHLQLHVVKVGESFRKVGNT